MELTKKIYDSSPSLSRYSPWFYAATIYNLVWGLINIFFPRLFFDLVGMIPPEPIAIWQVVGMFVMVFAPGYWWAARFPEKYPHDLDRVTRKNFRAAGIRLFSYTRKFAIGIWADPADQ